MPAGCGVVDNSIVRARVCVGSSRGKSIVVALAATLHVAARVGAIARTESFRPMAGVTPPLQKNIIRCDYGHIVLRYVEPTGHLLPGDRRPQSDNVAFCCRRLGGLTAQANRGRSSIKKHGRRRGPHIAGLGRLGRNDYGCACLDFHGTCGAIDCPNLSGDHKGLSHGCGRGFYCQGKANANPEDSSH